MQFFMNRSRSPFPEISGRESSIIVIRALAQKVLAIFAQMTDFSEIVNILYYEEVLAGLQNIFP
jgi:hypothetical protein